MVGTVLAVLFGVLALVFPLIVHLRYRELLQAKPTQKGHREPYVTREELEEAIAESTKELQYEWNEWYEKFNTLHLRLSKRAKRAAQAESNGQHEHELELEQPQLSVLSYRRMTSP